MKKIFIFGAIFAGFLNVAWGAESQLQLPADTTDYFSGFYIGGTMGLHQMNVNSSSTVTMLNTGGLLPSADSLINSSGGGTNFEGFSGVQGGFGKVFSHQVYLGVNGFANSGSQSVTSSSSTSFQRGK